MKNFETAYLEILNEQFEISNENLDTENFFTDLYELYNANKHSMTLYEFYEKIADMVYLDNDQLSESSKSEITNVPSEWESTKHHTNKKNKEWATCAKKDLHQIFKKRLLSNKFGKTTDTANESELNIVESALKKTTFNTKMKAKVRKSVTDLSKKEKQKNLINTKVNVINLNQHHGLSQAKKANALIPQGDKPLNTDPDVVNIDLSQSHGLPHARKANALIPQGDEPLNTDPDVVNMDLSQSHGLPQVKKAKKLLPKKSD